MHSRVEHHLKSGSHLRLVLLTLAHTLHLQQVLGHTDTGQPRQNAQMTRQAELCRAHGGNK